MAVTKRGFGVAAAIAPEVIRSAAQVAESLGYASFWANDTPEGDGLAALSEAAADTVVIRLGVGVIALSRRSPESILARIQQSRETEDKEAQAGEVIGAGPDVERVPSLDLPLDRLILGIGSGAGGPGAVERVRAGIRALKGAVDCEVVVAALGPRMCRLAGEEADGVLFNWLTPEYARRATE
ncbi:MAG: LLM class flavin-dependent oxidoreductase, partial [Thermomicrobiaceae bacterium]|nr:LLM class flavin-dependent oxidoreductase [Thermomicrobiaceae bacterium]